MHSFVTYPISLIENGNIVGGLFLLALYVSLLTIIILMAYDSLFLKRHYGHATVQDKYHDLVVEPKKKLPKPERRSGEFVPTEKDPNRWYIYFHLKGRTHRVEVTKRVHSHLEKGYLAGITFTQSRLGGDLKVLEARNI